MTMEHEPAGQMPHMEARPFKPIQGQRDLEAEGLPDYREGFVHWRGERYGKPDGNPFDAEDDPDADRMINAIYEIMLREGRVKEATGGVRKMGDLIGRMFGSTKPSLSFPVDSPPGRINT